jgi:hypothetical protein
MAVNILDILYRLHFLQSVPGLHAISEYLTFATCCLSLLLVEYYIPFKKEALVGGPFASFPIHSEITAIIHFNRKKYSALNV